jgi:hypothetical protein
MSCEMFKCEMCGKQVTRPKSFSLKALTGKDGRICRSHPAIIVLLREKIDEKTLRSMIVRFAFSFQLEKLMAGIRLLYTLYGTYPQEVFDFMKRRRFDPADVQQAESTLVRMGGAKMTPEQAYLAYSNYLGLPA